MCCASSSSTGVRSGCLWVSFDGWCLRQVCLWITCCLARPPSTLPALKGVTSGVGSLLLLLCGIFTVLWVASCSLNCLGGQTAVIIKLLLLVVVLGCVSTLLAPACWLPALEARWPSAGCFARL